MPKIKSSIARAKHDEINDIRRNLKIMTKKEMEKYIKGESLRKILGSRFIIQKIKKH